MNLNGFSVLVGAFAAGSSVSAPVLARGRKTLGVVLPPDWENGAQIGLQVSLVADPTEADWVDVADQLGAVINAGGAVNKLLVFSPHLRGLPQFRLVSSLNGLPSIQTGAQAVRVLLSDFS